MLLVVTKPVIVKVKNVEIPRIKTNGTIKSQRQRHDIRRHK